MTQNLAVPKQLNYADVLPVAIESRSNKRTFEPTNGTKFSPSGTNVIRLNLNSDNLADFTHSYLQATITNTAANGAANLALDTGIPWIQKVQIMSGGQELETIDAYNRLHSMLQSVQGNPEQAGEFSLTQKEHFASAITPTASVPATALTATVAAASNDVAALTLLPPGTDFTDANASAGNGNAADAAAATTALINAAIGDVRTKTNLAIVDNTLKTNNAINALTGKVNAVVTAVNASRGIMAVNDTALSQQKDFFHHNDNTVASQHLAPVGAGKFTYNFTLISAILNQPKYFPLIFTNMGLDILIYLEDAVNIGAWEAAPVGSGYEITDVRYHCHLVDVDKSFYDRMRQSMMSSGGVLQFSGTTYKHYLDSAANNVSPHQLQISTRVRSLNALYVRPQRQALNNQHAVFCISQGESCGMKSFQYRIGSVVYPQQAVKVVVNNMGESYNELRKCIGVLGNYSHNSWINEKTYITGPLQVLNGSDFEATRMTDAAVAATTAKSGGIKNFFVAAYGFAGFAKTAAESGINISDRALVCTCVVERDSITTSTNAIMPSEIRYDMFAETDILIFLTADGQISTRI